MPEFVMLIGDNEAEWKELDAFTQGYIEAMFFTENGSEEFPPSADFSDLAPEALATIKEECRLFSETNAPLLEAAYNAQVSYDAGRAGNDYWYTRNRHGVGYWDRGLGAIGDSLTVIAHVDGEVYPYMGDDGKLYV